MSATEGESSDIEPYRMHVSQRYLDLTRQKLELTRLPRELLLPQNRNWHYGVPKQVIEPIVDHWLEVYDWRAREAQYNDVLPQFRTEVNVNTPDSDKPTPFRVHFVFKRSSNPNAIPLLFCHGWPPSFIEVRKIIESLTEPVSTPPRGDADTLAFHLVVPSIPGFGFSDASPDESFGIRSTAELFDKLMKRLGFAKYVAYGGDWGFKVCRMLSLHHSDSCLAVHTTTPDLPRPTLRPGSVSQYLNFGYLPSDFSELSMGDAAHGVPPSDEETGHGGTTPLQAPSSPIPSLPSFHIQDYPRPQTIAYSLCDSPVGLLSCILDTIRPSLEISPWTPSDILDWTMMHWLPGPEAGLRWLRQAMSEASRDCWRSYSHTPLGISVFRRAESDNDSTVARGEWSPVWAEGLQRLAWVRRHETLAKWPAWDAPEQLVVDLRDCFREMMETGVLQLERDGHEGMAMSN